MKDFIKKRNLLFDKLIKKESITSTFPEKRKKLIQKFDSKLNTLVKKLIFNKCGLDPKYGYSIFNRSTLQIFKINPKSSERSIFFQFSLKKDQNTDSYKDITLSLINYSPTSLEEDLEKFILIGKISKLIQQKTPELISGINKIYDTYKSEYLKFISNPMDKNFKDISLINAQGLKLENDFLFDLIKEKKVLKFNPCPLDIPNTEVSFKKVIQMDFTPLNSHSYKVLVKSNDLDVNNCNITYELEVKNIRDFIENSIYHILPSLKDF